MGILYCVGRVEPPSLDADSSTTDIQADCNLTAKASVSVFVTLCESGVESVEFTLDLFSASSSVSPSAMTSGASSSEVPRLH